MNMRLLLLLLFGSVVMYTSCQSTSAPIDSLAARVTENTSKGQILFRLVTDEADPAKDYFEIDSKDGKVLITGNSDLSLATGLNWYLKYVAGIHLSWNNPSQKLPEVLPLPQKKIRQATAMKNRYYLNYCTYSYSMAFWDWERWEKEIDWMAMHGINMPLSITGMEVVWYNLLKRIGYTTEEINEFISKEYWTLNADFYMDGEKKPLNAEFYGTHSKKMTIESEKEMDEIVASLKKADFHVEDVKKSQRTKKAPQPFTTSTLQQEAAKTLNFSTQKTMRLAQGLYEGVTVKGRGSIGLITYLRTDSTRISEEAKAAAKDYITENYGQEYLAEGVAEKKSGKKIQDAHEAIRPSYIDLTPAQVKESLNRDQFRLYQLIWKRFMASQMAAAKYETTSVKIDTDKYRFTAASSKVAFQGYLNVYQTEEDKVEKKTLSKNITKGAVMKAENLEKKQHFTQPPAHFTEASLVKTLEELGIGRPSTYAPTISTIINRHYVAKEQKQLYVTELGEVVNSIMKKSFPSIVDVNFTAAMEGLLDCVEDGTVKWKTVIENFYPDLKEAVDIAQKELEEVTIEDEVTDVICEECGRNMVVKYGPHGKFLACPGFPDCRNTKPFFEKIGVECPDCGGDLVMKMSRKGRRYFGCMNFPECDFMTWQKPSAKKCPQCGGLMQEKGSKLVCMDEQCGYVEAKPKEK